MASRRRATATASRTLPTLREQAYVPARLRQALTERLDTGVVQIQAPAGCGKTSVTLQFLLDAGIEPGWHTCTAEDVEPAILLAGLVRALGGDASPEGRTTLAALAAKDVQASHGAVLRPFFGALREVPHAPVLVVDDGDVLLASPPALQALDHLIESCDGLVTVVLLSRAELPLGSQAKRLLEGRAARVMAEDLLLRRDEIAELAAAITGEQLPEPDADQLYRATGGWAIAVRLALRLGSVDAGGTHIRDAGHAQFTPEARADLFSYLASEILSRVDDRTRTFLRRTAILETLDPAACASLTGEERPVELIQSLSRAGLPVVKAGWSAYRCHSLLREYLLDGLSDDERAQAHADAARAYTEARDWPRAIAHFASAGDISSALSIVAAHGRELFYGGSGRAMVELAKRATGDELDAHNGARFWAAFAAARMFDLEWAAEAFERAHATATEQHDAMLARDALRCLTQLLNGWGRYPAATAAAQRLLDSIPENDRSTRAAASLGYLVTAMGATGQFREAVETIRRMLPDLAREPRADGFAEAYARSVAAVTLAMEGDFAAARAELSQARVLILGREDDDIHTFVPWSAGLVEFMAANPDAADQAAFDAETRALQYGDLQRVLECRALRACTATMRGNVAEADRRFAQLDELRGRGADYWGVVLTLLSRPERARLHGDIAGALAAAEANHALAVSLGGGRFVCSTRLDICYFRMLMGDAASAEQQARAALAEANELGAALLVYGASLMLAASSANDEAAAMADALRIADERDYAFLMPYVVRLPQLDAALWRALGSARASRAALLLTYTGAPAIHALKSIEADISEAAALNAIAVLAAYGAEGRQMLRSWEASKRRRVAAAATDARATADAANPHHLSVREREVLGLLAEGLRTKDVAVRLVLTPATVSTHIQRIMAKTGTSSRAELLALAARESVSAVK